MKVLKSWLFRALLVVSVIMLSSVQQVAADLNFSPNDFQCALQGELGGTCFYDPTCSSQGNSTADLTPGTGAPDGTTFPNLDPTAMANAINKWVVQQNPNTTFKDLGATIVASAQHSDINPFLLVAIPRIESSMGDPGDFNIINGNNAFGREAAANQPHFNGSHMWYKWSSVKASVDYTAPENKGAVGGGDMASYIKQEYGSDISKGDLVALITKYAPPSENDTAAYIANVKSWIAQLASLAQGGSGAAPAPAPTDNSSGNNCSSCSSGIVPPQSPDAPTVVIDPGHGPSRTVVDTATGLNMVESPGGSGDEIGHVWNVANIMKKDLTADGYHILLTKSSIDDTVTFRDRANVADGNNADLALSIHGDTTLANPGEIYVQKVGLYRGSGSDKTVFTDAAVASKSQSYATIFQQQREKVSGSNVVIRDDSFDGRGGGMEPGNIPMVALFSKTPWVYNEKHMPFDDNEYAKELEAGVKQAVPAQNNPVNNTLTTSAPSGACDNSSTGSGSVQDIVNLAMKLSWSNGPNGSTQKTDYADAVKAALAKGWYVGGGSPIGDDCGGFVTVVMRTSGADPNYNDKKGNTVAQQAYLDAEVKAGKYKDLGQPTSTKDLQPGDIAINSGHTFIYVGPPSDHPSFHGDQASASLPDRAPSAELLGVYPGHPDGPFTFYRLIKPGA